MDAGRVVARFQIGLQVCATEPIDGLLGVADIVLGNQLELDGLATDLDALFVELIDLLGLIYGFIKTGLAPSNNIRLVPFTLKLILSKIPL